MASVVQSPRRVKHVNDVVTQLETGDLRLRVRVLEAEEAFARIEAVQESLTAAVMATLFLNAGVFLSGMATAPALIGSRALFTLAGFFGVQIPVGYFKVRYASGSCLTELSGVLVLKQPRSKHPGRIL